MSHISNQSFVNIGVFFIQGRLVGNSDVSQAAIRVRWISKEEHLNVSIDLTTQLNGSLLLKLVKYLLKNISVD